MRCSGKRPHRSFYAHVGDVQTPVEARMTSTEALGQAGLVARGAAAPSRAADSLLALQCPGGHWQGLVEAAANLEAEYVFVNRLLGRQRSEQERRMAERLPAAAQAERGGA